MLPKTSQNETPCEAMLNRKSTIAVRPKHNVSEIVRQAGRVGRCNGGMRNTLCVGSRETKMDLAGPATKVAFASTSTALRESLRVEGITIVHEKLGAFAPTSPVLALFEIARENSWVEECIFN